MPFIAQNWAVIAQSSNIPQRTLQDGTIVGAPGLYSYQSHTETLGAIASDVTYFSEVDVNLFAGDLIYIVGSDASAEFNVQSVDRETGNVIIAQDAGSGNVVGPGSSTDNAVVRYNGTTGLLIQNSVAILSDSGVLSGLTGLVSSGLTYPTADAAAGSHMVTDGAGHLLLQPVSAGGDVFGPTSSIDNHFARFNGTTGKLIQDGSPAVLSDSGVISGLTGLSTAGATIGSLNYATNDAPSGYVMKTDGAGNLTLQPDASGTGDVVGPASATDNALARFNTTTGKLIQNSTAILDDSGNIGGLLTAAIGSTTIRDIVGGVRISSSGDMTLTSATVMNFESGSTYNFGPGIVNLLNGSSVRLQNAAGTHYFDMKASPSATADTLFIAPVAPPTTANQVLTGNLVGGNTVTSWVTNGAGTGDVIGPSSATDNALARFDSTTGKLIQNSVGVLSDAGALSGLTGLVSSGITYPTSDGTSGYVMTTNGAGVLSLQPASGGGSGTVTSLTAGANLVASPTTITTTGSYALNPNIGLTSAAFGTLTLNSGGLNNSNGIGNISFTVGANTPFVLSQNQITATQNIFIQAGKSLGFLSTDGTKDTLFAISPSQTATTIEYFLPVAGPTSDNQVLSGSAPVSNQSQLTWENQTGGFTTSVITTGTPVTATNKLQYVANSSSLVDIILPASPAIGDEYRVIGLGSGGWRFTIGATNQIIRQGIAASISTTTGSIAATNRYDDVTLVCVDTTGPAVFKAICPTGTMNFT